MITSKQYDELTDLLGKYRDAVSYLHTAAPEDRLDAAYDFAKADIAIEAYVLGLVDFDKERAAEDDGWIEWGGGVCPVETGTLVDVRYRDGQKLYALPANKDYPGARDASKSFWKNDRMPNDIVAFRIVRK